MGRRLAVIGCLAGFTGCVIAVGSSRDFLVEKPPGHRYGVLFGSLAIPGARAQLLRVISDQPQLLSGSDPGEGATVDAAGNFIFVLEPGGYFLSGYRNSEVSGRRSLLS